MRALWWLYCIVCHLHFRIQDRFHQWFQELFGNNAKALKDYVSLFSTQSDESTLNNICMESPRSGLFAILWAGASRWPRVVQSVDLGLKSARPEGTRSHRRASHMWRPSARRSSSRVESIRAGGGRRRPTSRTQGLGFGSSVVSWA